MTERDNNTGHEEESDGDGRGLVKAMFGGAIGGAVGGPPLAAAGAIAGIAEEYVFSSSDTDELTPHNKALLIAASEMASVGEEVATPKARQWMAHIDGAEHDLEVEEGGTGGVLDELTREPDIIYYDKGGTTSDVLVEVETMEGIYNDQSHAASQLTDFEVNSYAVVMAVPEHETEEAWEWVQEYDGANEDRVYVVAARRMGEFIRTNVGDFEYGYAR